jgi:uncharacterized protein
MTPAQLIEAARREAGLTQAEVARDAGTSQPAVARYERGIDVPTIPTLERLLAACGRGLLLTAVRRREGKQASLLRRERRRLLAAAELRGARRIRVFGSVARGDQRPDSDIDLLVEFERGRTLVDIAGFQNDARAILGWDVDVATPQILREEFRDQVLADSRPL